MINDTFCENMRIFETFAQIRHCVTFPIFALRIFQIFTLRIYGKIIFRAVEGLHKISITLIISNTFDIIEVKRKMK